MNCQNCGKEEVNFHYTSNINGQVSEKKLCAECAGKLGYSGGMPATGFEGMFADFFGLRPRKRAPMGYGLFVPAFVMPPLHILLQGAADTAQPAATEAGAQETDAKPEVDGEMQKRREINMLREQMRSAAEAEDYEKAAQLRDSIREMEKAAAD